MRQSAKAAAGRAPHLGEVQARFVAPSGGGVCVFDSNGARTVVYDAPQVVTAGAPPLRPPRRPADGRRVRRRRRRSCRGAGAPRRVPLRRDEGCTGPRAAWPLPKDPFAVTVWNTRGLLSHDAGLAKKKWREVTRLAALADVVFLQECHGTQEELELCASQLGDSHVAVVSAMPSRPDAGGLMVLLRRAAFPGAAVQRTEPLPGRIVMAEVQAGGSALRMCNVHNHEVPSRVVQSIATRVLRESAQATPPIWICGGG